jgi:hypothetical protein
MAERKITYWLVDANKKGLAQPLYGVGKWGPRYLVSTDDEQSLQHLVDALNEKEARDGQ